ECLGIDQTITGISGTTIEFSSLPDELAVGDYVCLAGESPVPQIPVEFHALLAQEVVVKVLEALGKSTKDAKDDLKTLKENLPNLITPRVQGESRRVVNRRPITRYV